MLCVWIIFSLAFNFIVTQQFFVDGPWCSWLVFFTLKCCCFFFSFKCLHLETSELNWVFPAVKQSITKLCLFPPCTPPLFLQGFICGFSIATGAAARLLSGYDSYGNICGQKNIKVEGIVNSGLDLTHKKWVFTLAIASFY